MSRSVVHNLIQSKMLSELMEIQSLDELDEYIEANWHSFHLLDKRQSKDSQRGLITALAAALVFSNKEKERLRKQIDLAERYIRDVQSELKSLKN